MEHKVYNKSLLYQKITEIIPDFACLLTSYCKFYQLVQSIWNTPTQLIHLHQVVLPKSRPPTHRDRYVLPGGGLTGMDTMIVGWWVGVGNFQLVKMHLVGGCCWIICTKWSKDALNGQNLLNSRIEIGNFRKIPEIFSHFPLA